MIMITGQRIGLAALVMGFSITAHAAQPPGGVSSGAPGTPTPTPYGQAPAPAVHGSPSSRSAGPAPLLPAAPRAKPAPSTDQGLPQLRQPQAPVTLPKADAPKP